MGGNLIERSVDLDGAGAGSPVVTKHAYDENGNAWADLTAGGSLTTRRIYADAVDALMARIGSSNDEDWYLTDLLGSVRDIADSTGASINHLDYNTFGGVATETSPTDGDRYAWTGRERDVETGLQYNRARWYDPATKRWLSQDPMGFDAGDSNLYRYATNSAASSADPRGMLPPTSLSNPDISRLYRAYESNGRSHQGMNLSRAEYRMVDWFSSNRLQAELEVIAIEREMATVASIQAGTAHLQTSGTAARTVIPPYRDLVANDMQATATPAFIAHQRLIGVQGRFMTELASLVPIPGLQQGIMYFNQFMDQVDPYSVSQIPRMMADTRGLTSVASRATNAPGKIVALDAAVGSDAQILINAYGQVSSRSRLHREVVAAATEMGWTGEVILLRRSGSGQVGAGIADGGRSLIVFQNAYQNGFRVGERFFQGRSLIAHEIGHLSTSIPLQPALAERQLAYWLREAQASSRGLGLPGLSATDQELLAADILRCFREWRRRGGRLPGEQ